jgi:hypothetical protein
MANGKGQMANGILPFEFLMPQLLPHPQFIHLLKRRATFTANDRATVAAYERLLNMLAT